MSPLIHVGYHKTATSWLQSELFRSAPFRHVASRGEISRLIVEPSPLSFDPNLTTDWFHRRWEARDLTGVRPVLSHERLSGYPASGGYDSVSLADRLAAVFPSARILIVIREQESLLRSWYYQYVRDGGVLGIEDFLCPPQPSFRRVPYFSVEFYEFDRLISYYQQRFTDDRVLVLPYELLRVDPASFLGRIAEFSDVRLGPTEVQKRANVRVEPSWMVTVRLANRLFNLNQLNPNPVFDSQLLRSAVVRMGGLTKRMLPAPLSQRLNRRIEEEICRRVGDHYKSSNVRTAGLTGLPLRTFGYAM